MRNLVKYVGIGLLVMGLAACDDKDTNATAQGSVAESNATGNPVNLLDGKLSFSLPADMTDQSGKLGTQANNMHVWSDATGQKAVIVIMGDDPKEDLAVMSDGKIVEQGDVETLFNAPKHTVTRSLVSAHLALYGMELAS